MKKYITILISFSLLFFVCTTAFATTKQVKINNDSDESVNSNDFKTKNTENDSAYAIERAKTVAEEYLRVNMKKYDPAAKDELSYDNIIKVGNPFKEYAEKMLILINYRYRVYDSLALNAVNYRIEYGNISYDDEIIRIHLSVLEEKDYKNQDNFGYVFTNHIITIEQDKGYFYIKEDLTDDYLDRYFREYADKDRCTVDDLIEIDKETIRDELNLNEEEMKSYLQNKEMNICSRVAISQVDSFPKDQESDNETGETVKTNPKGGSDNKEEYNTDNRDVQHHNFNFNSMYTYASHYNGASPEKLYNRNPAYVNYDNSGGDCTNYISQILRAGGAPNDNTGSYRWYYFSATNRSASWTSVNYLYNYLINNTYIGPQGEDITYNGNYYNASKGDLIQLKFSTDGSYIHSLWITAHQQGTTALTTIACHTSDRWNDPLDSITGMRRWIKLTGYDE